MLVAQVSNDVNSIPPVLCTNNSVSLSLAWVAAVIACP
jgi:hypothetical protein